MKITGVRVRKVRGTMATEGPFWEERLVRPVDIYPEYRAQQHLGEYGRQVSDRALEIENYFLTVETDEGAAGIAGPFREPCAHIVATQLRPILVGKDPLASEHLWDVMHRLLVHGRQGEAMFAISVVDCALWDLKGKWLGQPVWRLLGGPTRTEIPAYASMLGYAVLDPGLRARTRADGQGAGLPCAEVVLPPRADERRGRPEEERRAGADAARGLGRRRPHHARLLAELRVPLSARARSADRGVPPLLARRAGNARPHRHLPADQGEDRKSPSPAPSTTIPAGA